MNKKSMQIRSRCLMLLAASALLLPAQAQRKMDKLDRGLVAVPANSNGGTGKGNFVSWRIFGEEYYDVTYNLYCDGTCIARGLRVSNFSHADGTAASRYQVAAVVKGVEQEKSSEVARWADGCLEVPMQPASDRDGIDVSDSYALNDVSLGDVNGDGVAELIVKRNYTGNILDAANKTRFNRYECYDIKGKRLWWIDLGPNLMAGPDEQWDLISFDWDEDGKAECIMRGADNMIIHTSTGRAIKIGNMDYIAPRTEYTRDGAEYLLYLNGETGEPYGWDKSSDAFSPMVYPLPRFENGETDYAAAWGANDTGHRSCKHYFGAPYLDGRHPSIFLGRGCYTRHKMCALDVNPENHQLTQRWRWNDLGGAWFGNGYHNFAIADVDMDGRDEIVFGQMVIDDNGKGLCTTGLGHGDSQHCADFDPYRKGLEQFACNETHPACTYYNATTGKIYYRLQTSGDDGRALCGNFTNDYPGSVGRSTQSGIISCTKDKPTPLVDGGIQDGMYWSHLNQRIYWDGDLLDEVMDSPGASGKSAAIYKAFGGRILTLAGVTNNASKNNPSALGDIFGDWREELVLRKWDNKSLLIYTTAIPTEHRIYTLWHDHQYRNAMVWQCVGYNQTPHKSYFLGEMEGITVPPPPLTTVGRVEIANGGTIGNAHKDKHVLVCETNDTQINVSGQAAPDIATFNVPSWVQGKNSDVINGEADSDKKYYVCDVKGGAFSGPMRLVKQGDGILNLPAVEENYTGPTDIWAGTLNFDGKMLNSPVWLNRFAALNSNGGQFRSIKMDYASILRPGAEGAGTIQTDSLKLGFGSRVVFDIYNKVDGSAECDKVSAKLLSIENRQQGNWVDYGPEYLTPVVQINAHGEMKEGKYLLFDGLQKVEGKLSDLVIEGVDNTFKVQLEQEDDKVYLVLSKMRAAADVFWNGNVSDKWELGGENNFTLTQNPADDAECFVTGDVVRFTDAAANTHVTLQGKLEANSVIVNSSKDYTWSGMGSIVGKTKFLKAGTGKLAIRTDNTFTGGVRISGGTVVAQNLSNANQAYGSLGAVTSNADDFIIENGATLNTLQATTQDSPMMMMGELGGVIDCASSFQVNQPIQGTVLTKKGNGWMGMNVNSKLSRLIVDGGGIQCLNASRVAATVEFRNGTYSENTGSNFTIEVPKGYSGTWNTANRSVYSNRILGAGTLTIYCEEEKGNGYFATRTQLGINLKDFEGIINATGRPDDAGKAWTLNSSTGMPKGTLCIEDGLCVLNTGKTYAIGKLAGKGMLGGLANFGGGGSFGRNIWKVGNDEDWTWGGIVTHDAQFVKTGLGKAVMSGASNTTGAVTIQEGEINLKSGARLGSGILTIYDGAVLSGITSASVPLANAKVNLKGGATLQVGNSATAVLGSMYFGGKDVTFEPKSILRLGINGKASGSRTGGTCIQNIGNLVMNGTVQLYYSAAAISKFQVGDYIELWKDVAKVSGTPLLENPVIDSARGLYWDTRDISQGILRVTDQVPTGILLPFAEQKAESRYYDSKGISLPVPKKGINLIRKNGKTSKICVK